MLAVLLGRGASTAACLAGASAWAEAERQPPAWKTAHRSFYYATAEEPADIELDPRSGAELQMSAAARQALYGGAGHVLRPD